MKLNQILSSVALAVAVVGAQASPVLVFESAAANGSSSRGAASGILTRFEVASTVSLTNIAIEMDLASAGNLKYMIFNSVTGALLFESAAQAFADDGMTYKMSDTFAFDLVAGTRYAIGAFADVANIQNFVVPGGLTVGDITSLGGNQNVQGTFASPVFNDGIAGTDGRIRLYTAGTTTVPVPGTLLLAGLALLAASAARRRTASA